MGFYGSIPMAAFFRKKKDKKEKKEVEKSSSAASSQVSGEDTPKRILIIDDAEIDRMILEEILTQAGYEVTTAADGVQGLERFHENPTEVVISDMVMPGKMGQDVIWEIKEASPDTEIVAVSGGGDFGVEMELSLARDVGATYALSKPFNRDMVIEVVNKLFQNIQRRKKG
jgi:DNA-binding NtrC family response regulator